MFGQKINIGIIAPSIIRNNWGLYQQLKILVNFLKKDFNFIFYFDEDDLKNKDYLQNFKDNFKNTTNKIFSINKINTTQFKIRQDIKQCNIQVFIIFTSYITFWNILFRNISTPPIIYSERSEPKHVLYRCDIKEYSEFISRVNRCVVFNPEFINLNYNNKYVVIPQFFYKRPWDDNIIKNNNSLLYVGYINSYPKQSDLLFEIVSKNSDLNLTVAGTGNFDIIKKYKKYKNINFIGFLQYKEIYNYYRQHLLTCIPSITEGSPNVALESISCGTPIIGLYNCIGLKNTVLKNKTGILTTTLNFEADICNYLDDKEFQKYMISNCMNAKSNITEVGNLWKNLIYEHISLR